MVESMFQFVPFLASHIKTTDNGQGAQSAEGCSAWRVAVKVVKDIVDRILDLVLITPVEELARTFVE
jgi:hypothetical protein